MSKQQIPFSKLVAYVEDRLDEPARAAVSVALGRDPGARARVERIRQVIGTLRGDDTTPPTPDAVGRAAAVFPVLRPHGPEPDPPALPDVPAPPDVKGRCIAALVHDSGEPSAMSGFRAGCRSGRRLAYESELARVDLGVTVTDRGARRVRGQADPASPTRFRRAALHRLGDHERVADAPVDEHGVFRLDVAPGVYHLVLEWDEGLLVAPSLEID